VALQMGKAMAFGAKCIIVARIYKMNLGCRTLNLPPTELFKCGLGDKKRESGVQRAYP
jgi:hypothetical protein